MNANELRLGNWVCILGTEIYREINSLRLHEISIGLENTLRPIPLTEDWLLKFGFKWKNQGLRLGSFCIRQEINSYVIYLSNESHNTKVDLKHVHQLQNLYFALTGIELIKKATTL
jgi:hypothetical protein